nr:5943_t:CDS:2 [Entrophospora candida]
MAMMILSCSTKQQSKSYLGFLQKTIINLASLSSSNWKAPDDLWSNQYLTEAKKLDKSNYEDLENKVKSERTNLKSYWEGILRERSTDLAKLVNKWHYDYTDDNTMIDESQLDDYNPDEE